jgi:hypothetical protein
MTCGPSAVLARCITAVRYLPSTLYKAPHRKRRHQAAGQRPSAKEGAEGRRFRPFGHPAA